MRRGKSERLTVFWWRLNHLTNIKCIHSFTLIPESDSNEYTSYPLSEEKAITDERVKTWVRSYEKVNLVLKCLYTRERNKEQSQGAD